MLVTQERLEIFREKINQKPLEIFDQKDKNGKATGTKVEIRIPII
jgi:hypothetical protein